MSPIRVGQNLFVTEFDELKLGEIPLGVSGLVLAELRCTHMEKLKRLLTAFPALVRLGVGEASFEPDHLVFLMGRLQYLRIESFFKRFWVGYDFSAFIAIAPFTRCVFDFPTTPGLEAILPVFEREREGHGYTNFGLAVGGEPVYGVDDRCSICLDEETPCDFFTPCGHMFHRSCVLHLRNSRCPNCRDCILPPRRAHHLLPDLSVVWEGYETGAMIGGLAESAIIVAGRATDGPHLVIDERAPRPANLYLLVKNRNTANHYRALPTHELHIFFQPKREQYLTTDQVSDQGLKWRFSPVDGQRAFPHGVSRRALANTRLWNRLLDVGLDFETALEIFKSEEK